MKYFNFGPISHQLSHKLSNHLWINFVFLCLLEMRKSVNNIDCLSIGYLDGTYKILLFGDIVVFYIDTDQDGLLESLSEGVKLRLSGYYEIVFASLEIIRFRIVRYVTFV